MYDLFMDPDEPLFLAQRRSLLGIPERLDANGCVVVPLDEAAVLDAGRELIERQRVDAVVVCYLHSYLNPAHERRTRELLAARYPDLEISISSDVDPRYREYERLVLTGFDAYVRPVIRHYLAGLQERMAESGITAPLQVMRSRGGINGVWSVLQRPEGTILSGPAAGVIGATHVAKLAGFPDSISLDVGGTSADVALCEGGQPVVSTDGHIDRYPLRPPMIDVRTIGAGGGSAWVDEGGVLKVGPRSAGARPGPACYGRGGLEPTVTDASVVLGYLSPESFAGGIRLDPDLARTAVESKVAAPLGLDVARAALGIHRIVNANMAQTLRVVSIERGKDPRHFALVAFGGAGPIHAGRLAEEIGVRTVLVPPAPGVLSALGLLIANVEHEFSRTLRTPAATTDVDLVNRTLAEIDLLCAERMTKDGIAAGACQVHHSTEMRYAGQSYELEVPLQTPVTRDGLNAAVSAFHEAHRRVYAYAKEAAPVELVTVRSVHAAASPEKATIGQATPGHAPQARAMPPRTRKACFDAAAVHTSPSPARGPEPGRSPGRRPSAGRHTTVIIGGTAPWSTRSATWSEPAAAGVGDSPAGAVLPQPRSVTLEVLRGRNHDDRRRDGDGVLELTPAGERSADAPPRSSTRTARRSSRREARPPISACSPHGPAHRATITRACPAG